MSNSSEDISFFFHTDAFLTGKIDNVRLYNRVLTDHEIRYLASQKLKILYSFNIIRVFL
jgi:hypothetical protein